MRKVEIERTKSNSGNRTMWRVLVDGVNVTRTLYARKWEAENVYREICKRVVS